MIYYLTHKRRGWIHQVIGEAVNIVYTEAFEVCAKVMVDMSSGVVSGGMGATLDTTTLITVMKDRENGANTPPPPENEATTAV